MWNIHAKCNGVHLHLSSQLGSGLMVYRNNRWMIRGIVSAGLTNGKNGQCILTEYIIFTDVAKFLPWIRQYM